MTIRILLDTLVTGLPLVPAVLAIYLVFRIRDDFDLTVDGSLALGGAVTAVTVVAGWPPLAALAVAVLVAAAMGAVTAGLHFAFRIPVLLAGLVMSIGLFSVTLHVLGQPTVGVDFTDTLFAPFLDLPSRTADTATSATLAAIVVLAVGAVALFLRTEIGLALRATGVNAVMARSHGVNDRRLLVVSLILANGLAGLSGALVVQTQGFADVNMGTGTFVAGIGAVLLGELLVRPTGSRILRIALCVVVGALCYRLILVGALRLGLPAADLRGATAVTLLAAVAAQRWGRPLFGRIGRALPSRLPARSRDRAPSAEGI
ncbi:hypothetical protein KZZ52_27450 [Dactylosporangium sp. AC04546]|uniref:ABC transporter permease n=1 Tax=Dactylosporangium sp. AC04546 TaxID=2862460 RepID=UPI001EDE23CC|nr:hypothetical protein [Dactylosporangium sp. AC04546]WVK89002.1 hypothetical protein KZZ52_27450 [Dactylosporangium sp. AC04546]